MMFRQEIDIFHTGFFSRLGPLVGMTFGGPEEFRWKFLSGPFGAGESTERPADKHTKPQVFHFLGSYFIGDFFLDDFRTIVAASAEQQKRY